MLRLLLVFQSELVLVVELLGELPHHLRRLLLLAHGAEVLGLEPVLDTVRVVDVALVASERGNVVFTLDERLETNDAFVHATAVAVVVVKDFLVEQYARHGFDKIVLDELALPLSVGFLEDVVNVERQHEKDCHVRR